MGYMDISIGGSDTAADLHSVAVDALLKVYVEGMKHERYDNSYNTPTAINIAMSFNTVGRAFWMECIYMFEESDFLTKLDEMLEEVMEDCRAYHKEEGDSNSKWHLDEYGKIVRKFRATKKAIVAELERVWV
jgi:hypothetical protein